MAAEPLTARQVQAKEFIEGFVARHGRPPTIREVGAGLHLAHPNNARPLVAKLVEAGVIEQDRYRGIRLATRPWLVVPIRGIASCGPGAEQDDEPGGEELDLAKMFGRDDLAAYRAVGQSMRDDGIKPGDWLIVREQPDPENGQTVAAMLDRKMVCKRYSRKRDGTIRLSPCNSDMQAIDVDPSRTHVRILGVLYSVIRKF